MRLLLDIHISPAVARALAADGIDAVSLRDWQEGDRKDSLDERILFEAQGEGRVLVTFDQRTIPSMVAEWAQAGRRHAGVLMIARRTVRSNDVGTLIRAIRAFVLEEEGNDWTGRFDYLRLPPR